MNRVFESVLRYILPKVVTSYRRWQHHLKVHPELRQRIALFGAAAIAGLIIACIRILPTLTAAEIAPNTSAVQTAPAPNPTSLAGNQTQDDPRFAKTPSWTQNYINQTSGLPDPLYWNVLVGPAENSNNEQQYYTDSYSNVHVENGALRLIATKQSQPGGYQYSSARLETQGKKSFLYGRIDITAKIPGGVGTWPAVWMLPANDVYAKKSADNDIMRYKNGGEIDIIESVGFEQDLNYGVAHTLSDVSLHPDGTGSYKTINVPNSTTTFNIYTLLWTPTSLTFAVNGTPYYTYTRQDGADYKTWPFDQPFYLIANLAMGGNWGGMNTKDFPGNGIDNSALPASLEIQSIYYYPYIGSKDVR